MSLVRIRDWYRRYADLWEHWFSEDSFHDDRTYYAELNSQCRKGVIAAGAIAAVAFLRHIGIDRQMFPEFPELPVMRIILTYLSIFTVLVFIIVVPVRRYATVLWLIPGGYATWMAAFAAGMTGGSPAYIGSYILVIMLYTIVPFPRWVSWGMLAVSILFFLGGKLYTGYDYTANEAGFSVSTLRNSFIIAFVFIYISDRLRFNSYNKSLQLRKEKHNSELLLNQLAEELEMARRIQDALLPAKLPQLPEISIASKYLPFAKLGGDFFDTYVSDDRREIGLFICDVSGHGVPAALVASMVKMAMSIWPQHVNEPAKVIDHIYVNMKNKLSTQFISALICHIDLKTGKLTIASAGHLPLIVLRKNKSVEFYKPKGRIISEYFPPGCEQKEIFLEDSDSLVLYTDGITEARNINGEMFSEERFVQSLLRHSSLATGQMVMGVVADFEKFTLTNFETDGETSLFTSLGDDVTILAARYQKPSTSRE